MEKGIGKRPLCFLVTAIEIILCSALPSSGRVVSFICSTIFCDVTLHWLLPSSSTLTFQYPMVFCCWGASMGPIRLWDSYWPSLKSIIPAPAMTFVSLSIASDFCHTIFLVFFFYSRGLKFPLILLSSSHLYFTLPCLCFTTLLFLLNSPLLNCTLTVQLHFAINRLHKSILLLQCTGHHLVVVHCSSLTFVYLLPATKQLYSGFFIFFKVALKS